MDKRQFDRFDSKKLEYFELELYNSPKIWYCEKGVIEDDILDFNLEIIYNCIYGGVKNKYVNCIIHRKHIRKISNFNKSNS